MALAFVMVFGAMMPFATEKAHAFIGKKGNSYTVWDGGQIVYGFGSGDYSNSRKCDLGDDLETRYSYCVQPDKASPPTGKATVDKVITDDNNVKDIKGSYYTGGFTKDWAIAHLALSYVYAGRPSDLPTWGGTHASDLVDIWTKAKKLGDALWKADSSKDDAVPDSFKVFVCHMSGVQDMIVGYMEAPGYLYMKKAPNRTSITGDNACYSIEGAVYTVYDSSGSKAGTLTIKANGESNTIELIGRDIYRKGNDSASGIRS